MPAENVKISYVKNGKRTLLEMPHMRATQYQITKNPNIIFLLRLDCAKIYYDIERDDYFLYVFSVDRNKLLRKIKLEKHDVQWLLAFALYDRYSADLPKQLWINQDLKRKVQIIIERENQHYQN